MQLVDPNRYGHLKALNPLSAVRIWLAGDFRAGDEQCLLAAIHQDEKVQISDPEIVEIIEQAKETIWDAAECLERIENRAA